MFTSHIIGWQGRRNISSSDQISISGSTCLCTCLFYLRSCIMKIKSRWLCSCVMPAREVERDRPHFQSRGGADKVRENSSVRIVSVHQKNAVNISPRSRSRLSRGSKKKNFLGRFLERIAKRRSPSPVLVMRASDVDPNPEHRPGPRAGTSKDLVTSGNSKLSTCFSIELKREKHDPGLGILSQKRDINVMPLPRTDEPAVEQRQVYSVFEWTCGPRRLEDVVVMDGPILGEGTYGSVRLCSHKSTGHLMACKTIEKLKMENSYDLKEQVTMIRREVEMHQLCSDHPNVVQILGYFEDDTAVHILMEYGDKGCLNATLQQKLPRGLPVNAAAVRMKQLADALCWIHGKNIVHRDIKPKNILLVSEGRSLTHLKVADFGFAMQLQPQQGKDSGVLIGSKSLCGSPGFIAPEIRRKELYGTAVDIWSAGVVLCKMLTGKMPFADGQSVRDLDFSLRQWWHVPDEARHLVTRMLEFDPQMRISAPQILEHPWIKLHNHL